MGRDRSHIILGWQGADSPLPTPQDMVWGSSGAGKGWASRWDVGTCLWTAVASLGLPAAPQDGGTRCHYILQERARVPSPPCPISAFHTTKHHLPFCRASPRFPAMPRAQQRTKNHQAHFLRTPCCSRGSHQPPRCRLPLLLPFLPASHGCARSLPNNIPPALQNPVLVHPACIHPALEGSRC